MYARNPRIPQTPADLETVKSELHRLRGDFGELLQTLLQITKSESQEVKDKLYAQADQRLQELSRAFDNFRETGRHAVQAIQQRVEERPLISLAGAFLLGLIVGKITGDND